MNFNDFGNPKSGPTSLVPMLIAALILPAAANLAFAQSTAQTKLPSTRLASEQPEPEDLFTIVLIAADLQDATRVMTVHDPNEDGFIDKAEQKKLSWREEIPQYDLNKDGILTHLEVAVRQAKLRGVSGVTQFDRNNANRFLQRKDLNNNGQLDPDEIALGWPADPQSMDKNSDGIISLNEMAETFAYNRSFRRFIGIESVDQNEAIRLRNEFDADHDGKLGPDEWPTALLPNDPKQFDENGDGLLMIDEMAAALAKHRMDLGLSASDQTNARQLIRAADRNQDGFVSKEELQEPHSPGTNPIDFMVKYDSNSDGRVTLLEVEKLLGAERKKLGFGDDDFATALRLLTRHDANRSKFLENGELLDVAAPGQLSKSQLKLIDSNKDEKLAVEEIAKYLADEKKKDSGSTK